jgi:hypothetical protein
MGMAYTSLLVEIARFSYFPVDESCEARKVLNRSQSVYGGRIEVLKMVGKDLGRGTVQSDARWWWRRREAEFETPIS